MLITLIGSIIGFLSSIVPEIISVYAEKKNQNAEIALLKQQLEIERSQRSLDPNKTMDIINAVNNIINCSSGCISTLEKGDCSNSNFNLFKSSVRPVITYAMFALFISLKVYTLFYTQDIYLVWDEDTKAIFSVVLSFWFGQRAITTSKT